ncbi:MAG TPA: AMP-binding protein, partial [Chryseolinea sp.]|nr:AMP-binding protein [Chryseolinea sp.]
MKDFIWFKKYPKNVAHEIQINEYPNLVQLFDESCKKFKDQVAYENMGVKLTYTQVDTLSNHFAAFLQKDLGLKKGERIAIQMPNLLQFPIVFIGAIKAGLIVVNTNPLYTAREMEYQFKDSSISAIVIVANFCFNLEKVLANTPIKHIIITELGDMLGSVKGALVNFVVKKIKKMVPAYQIPQALKFKDVMKKGSSLDLTKPAIAPEDIAV